MLLACLFWVAFWDSIVYHVLSVHIERIGPAIPMVGTDGPDPGVLMHTRTGDMRVLGTRYTHFSLADEGDLYVTECGLPFTDCLFPENHWMERRDHNRGGIREPHGAYTREAYGPGGRGSQSPRNAHSALAAMQYEGTHTGSRWSPRSPDMYLRPASNV